MYPTQLCFTHTIFPSIFSSNKGYRFYAPKFFCWVFFLVPLAAVIKRLPFSFFGSTLAKPYLLVTRDVIWYVKAVFSCSISWVVKLKVNLMFLLICCDAILEKDASCWNIQMKILGQSYRPVTMPSSHLHK